MASPRVAERFPPRGPIRHRDAAGGIHITRKPSTNCTSLPRTWTRDDIDAALARFGSQGRLWVVDNEEETEADAGRTAGEVAGVPTPVAKAAGRPRLETVPSASWAAPAPARPWSPCTGPSGLQGTGHGLADGKILFLNLYGQPGRGSAPEPAGPHHARRGLQSRGGGPSRPVGLPVPESEQLPANELCTTNTTRVGNRHGTKP